MLDKMMEGFSDDDFRRIMLRSLRLMAIVTVVAALLLWWKMGWQTAALLTIGAVISGSGLWEWLRLMTAVMVRMDGGAKPQPMVLVLAGFFLRLGVAIAVLYVSLRFLNGSVYALAAGLAMGVFALTFEALKTVKAWTV
ncbi:MAG TPA: ATP synthase subunit I [Acidobacteriaceae bacterium]|nr:ATP synthase subunit I [Acidobacteriaceae bacterium]